MRVADETFRAEVRAFLAASLPPEMLARTRTAVHPQRDDILAWQAILARKGWSVPGWPVAHGGPGWSERQRAIFEEEQALAGAPEHNIQGVSLVGPVLYTFGTEAQQRRFLPAIREGREFWCQGFSEPNSGSDLASLRTRAVREGDVYVVNGQKIWTSQAMMADMCFCLVRTDAGGKPQLGISFLLISMTSPGVTVRPIQSIDEGFSLCEVFFDNVRVPAENLIGFEGKGWDYAKFLLANERTATAEAPRNKRYLVQLKAIAAAERDGETSLLAQPEFRGRIARAEVDLLALESGVERAWRQPDDTLLPSVLKLQGTTLMQTLTELQVEALGSHGAAYFPQGREETNEAAPPAPEHARDVAAEFLFRRAATIYGGSNEIQRNIVAKALLAKGIGTPQPDLSEERRMLADSVTRFVEKSYGFDARRKLLAAGSEAIARNWASFAEMGWLGAAIPEAAGGLGGTIDDSLLVLGGIGRALAVEPYLTCAVLAPKLVELAAADALRVELLAGIAEAKTVLALAHDEAGARGRWEHIATRAAQVEGGYRLSGAKRLVLGGDMAQSFLVTARLHGQARDRKGIGIFLMPRNAPGLAVMPYRTIDARQAVDLRLDGVEVESRCLIGPVDKAAPALAAAIDHAIVGACAEAVGAMEAALSLTLDYVRTRRQFGQPLAAFQALQHRLADMYVELERARSMLARAASALALPEEARRRIVAAAKASIGRSGLFVGQQCVQLHGGIGMTQECAAGHYLKRLMVLDMLHGDAQHHQSRYTQDMDNSGLA
ncbi:MAG: acyl-CoA dehydrogenase family protein [Bradyrhizobium sp.]|nr:acyl-CoA dehydrogenase family protein [Bradyrhizobium sp.]